MELLKWYESPIIGAVASSGKFRYKRPLVFESDSQSEFTLDLENLYVIQKGSHIENCTLLARHIEDMTGGEMRQYKSLKNADLNIFEEHEHEFFDTPESMLYLISIGVWAWDTDRVEFRGVEIKN